MIGEIKTPCVNSKNIEQKWWLIDASGLTLGRMASKIAMILRGKHKAVFTPNMDNGDNIVIINCEKVGFTHNKLDSKRYHWHSGHIGGIKQAQACDILNGKDPSYVIRQAVKGMLPKGPLGRKLMTNLYVYAGAGHPHAAQNPETYDFGAQSRKNIA